MSETSQNRKLQGLFELHPKLTLLSGIGKDERLSLSLTESLNENEVKYLNSGNFVIKQVLSSDGNPIRVSTLHTAQKGCQISLEVPRDPSSAFVAENIADLLRNERCLEKEPKEFLVLKCGEKEEPYWSGQSGAPPTEIDSYRSVIQLISILKKEADALTTNPTVATYFDVERIDIVIKSTTEIFSSAFPADELNSFLSEEGLSQTRRDAFRVTLWDKLKHFSPNERFGQLLKDDRGKSFMRALKYNFCVAKKDFSLDRRLEMARQEYRELAGNLSKLVSGLEAKAFVVPGTLLLAARFVEMGQGLEFKNLTICISASILAAILTIAYKTHQDIASEAIEEIDEAKKKLSEGQSDEEVSNKFARLKDRFKRVQSLKLGVVVLAWIVAGSLFIVCLYPIVPDQKPEVTPKETSNGVSDTKVTADTIDKGLDETDSSN